MTINALTYVIMVRLQEDLDIEFLLPYQGISKIVLFVGFLIIPFILWVMLNKYELVVTDQKNAPTEANAVSFIQKYKYIIFSVLLTIPTITEGYKYFTGNGMNDSTEKTFLIATGLLILNIIQSINQKKTE